MIKHKQTNKESKIGERRYFGPAKLIWQIIQNGNIM